ncbi:hypothetical protein WA577_001699 [Blastocystis sp. JDR]
MLPTSPEQSENAQNRDDGGNTPIDSQLHLEGSISQKSMDNSILRTSSAKQDELDKSVFSPKETGSVADHPTLTASVHMGDEDPLSLSQGLEFLQDSFALIQEPVNGLYRTDSFASIQPLIHPIIQSVKKNTDEYLPVFLIQSLPPYTSISDDYKSPLLPPLPNQKRLTLVLDLDETLVHCSLSPLSPYQHKFPIELDGQSFTVWARERPYLRDFLKYCSSLCEVILFTASRREYADELIKYFDPNDEFFSARFYRDSCTPVNGNYVKDLNRLQHDLARTVIVDNSIVCFGYFINNGVPITSWYDDWSDIDLYNLANMVRYLCSVDDVRPVLKSMFSLESSIGAFKIE